MQLEGPVVDALVVGAEEELRGRLDGAQRQGHLLAVVVAPQLYRVPQLTDKCG